MKEKSHTLTAVKYVNDGNLNENEIETFLSQCSVPRSAPLSHSDKQGDLEEKFDVFGSNRWFRVDEADDDEAQTQENHPFHSGLIGDSVCAIRNQNKWNRLWYQMKLKFLGVYVSVRSRT